MRYRRRSSRRSRSAWVWADSQSMALQDGPTIAWNSLPLLKPGRTKYLCDSDKTDHITVTGILLWLDFHWEAGNSNPTTLNDVELFVQVVEEDLAGNAATEYTPFLPPQPPGTLASWDTSVTDGLDSFLWCHFIKGASPPNYQVFTKSYNQSPDKGGNQKNTVGAADSDYPQYGVCRTFRVAAEWQPDVHIKTRRRLGPNEGIILGMRTPGTNTSTYSFIQAQFRVLAKRGRG